MPVRRRYAYVSIGKKTYWFLKENLFFHGSIVGRCQTGSQKMGLEHSSVWELSFHGMEDPPKSEFNNLCLYARFEQAKIRERSERDVRREELANCIQRALSTFTRLREHITYVILLLHCTFGFGDRQLLLAWFVYVNMSGSFVVKTRTKAIHETQ